MKRKALRLDTRLIHVGEPEPRIAGAVSMPVFQSATFEALGRTDYHDLGYIRLNNTPNHIQLHAKLADAEGTEAALVTSSGMAAITTTLLSVLTAGDHLLAQDCLYGGTHNFITEDLMDVGIDYDFIDGSDPASWPDRLRPATRAIYVETMTNPLLGVADHTALVDFAQTHGLLTIIDNTLATPINFRPHEHGYDIVVHSGTKYLNGHSDIVAGAVMGAHDVIAQAKRKLDHLGGCLDPHACFLLQRGLKTLGLRVRAQNRNALAIAEALAAHPSVIQVNYAGLPSHPHHDRAATLFDGCGGLLSFEVAGGVCTADAFIDRLRLPVRAPSLGGVESLVTRPAATSHAGMTTQDRQRLGIGDGLIRIAVGIEDTDDLVADFEQALNA